MRRYVFPLAMLTLAALAPSLARGDDQQIAQQILERLQAEKQAGTLKGFSIDLQVDEGTVWLSGRVASDEQEHRALDMARRVAGVKQVVDDLVVSAPPAKAVSAKLAPAPTPAPALPPVSVERSVVATPLPAAVPESIFEEPVIAAEPAPTPAAKPATSSRKSSSPAQTSVLNSVSKTLMNAVHGNRSTEQKQLASVPNESSKPVDIVKPAPVQPVSVASEIAAATGAAPIGSGIDQNAATSRRNVVQAAQPVANVPPAVVPTESLQPVAAAPQQMLTAPQHMTAMVPVQVPYYVPVYAGSQMQVPLAMGPARPVNYTAVNQGAMMPQGAMGTPTPMYMPGSGVGIAPARYDHPQMPGYAWPSYAAHPNYAAVTYPKQYSPTAWPYIGPFYPYPQVPLGWRKVTMEWDDGWWMLDFKDRRTMYNH